jgi:hypothetical protein
MGFGMESVALYNERECKLQLVWTVITDEFAVYKMSEN